MLRQFVVAVFIRDCCQNMFYAILKIFYVSLIKQYM